MSSSEADMMRAREAVAKMRIGYGEAIRKGEVMQEHVAAIYQGIQIGRQLERDGR